MRHMLLAVSALVALAGCGVYDHPPDWQCGAPDCARSRCDTADPRVSIEYHDYNIDGTNKFVFSEACVDSNLDILFTITYDTYKDRKIQDKAGPDSCLPVSPDMVTVAFQDLTKSGYRTPPPSRFEAKKGRRVIVTATYGK